jgi:uncharacterized membrane protein
MTPFARIAANLFRAWWLLPRVFPQRVLGAIQSRIAASERTHRGEIVFAVESRLPLLPLLRGLTSRRRAVQVFAGLGVWETEQNSGVLIYILLAEHAIEIFTDRGAARRVPQARWDAICEGAAQAFARGEFEGGAVAAVEAVGAMLREHFPAAENGRNPNELDDAPVVL